MRGIFNILCGGLNNMRCSFLIMRSGFIIMYSMFYIIRSTQLHPYVEYL